MVLRKKEKTNSELVAQWLQMGGHSLLFAGGCCVLPRVDKLSVPCRRGVAAGAPATWRKVKRLQFAQRHAEIARLKSDITDAKQSVRSPLFRLHDLLKVVVNHRGTFVISGLPFRSQKLFL